MFVEISISSSNSSISDVLSNIYVYNNLDDSSINKNSISNKYWLTIHSKYLWKQ